MTEPSPANLELSIALPLGVVANQLARIEADLRFLSMKASAYVNERESGQLAAKVAGGLERINEGGIVGQVGIGYNYDIVIHELRPNPAPRRG